MTGDLHSYIKGLERDKIELSDKLKQIEKPLLSQDSDRILQKIGQMKMLDGETWAIAEVAQRVLEGVTNHRR